MNDNKRYYWIKLKTDFFNQETIDFLLSQKNGCEYIVLYQMLCLNTANNNGEMCSKIGEMIVPYNVDKIVRDTKYFDFDTVTIALGLFKQLGLIYEEKDKILKITNFDEMIGSESKWANKKRQYREKQKQLALGQSEDNVRQEIEIDIRDRDKSIDKDIDNINNTNNNIYIVEFEEIWKAYPNKKGKENAMKDYVKARKDGVDYETIVNGLKKYLMYCKKEKKWYKPKNGSTWFHQRSWNDEYEIEITTEDLQMDLTDF